VAAGLAVACSIGFSIDMTLRMGGLFYAALFVFACLLAHQTSKD
jgi:hypothetical protein